MSRRMLVAALGVATIAVATAQCHAASRFVTLRCAPGHRVDATFTLYDHGEPVLGPVALGCPPDARIDLGELEYNGISAHWEMTEPDGSTSSGSLPAPDGSPGPRTDPDPGNRPWGFNPFAPRSYVCNSAHCTRDPAAPPFIQDGEILLGTYEEGMTTELTVRVVDPAGGALGAASVTALGDGGRPVEMARTDTNGRVVLNLPSGAIYSIRVGAAGHLPQVSDALQLLEERHMWTMVLTPGAVARSGRSDALLRTVAMILVVAILAFLFGRRRTSP